jgi:hypothetical protein
MKSSFYKLLFAFAFYGLLYSSAGAQQVSPIQSPYRPLGYPLASQVYKSGSDTLSASYNTNYNTYLSLIQQQLPEGVAFTGAGLNQLDPQRLYFYFAYAPRVYFIYEGAGYVDSLEATIATVSTPTSKPTTGTNYTLFPNQQSSVNAWCLNCNPVRSASQPLLPGDFVQLPTINAGQQLAFSLGSNLDSKGNPQYVFYNGSANNPDNYQHMIAFFPDNSQYIIIGFEDLYGGGDQDCNDLMFVVDVGPNNAAVWRQANSLPK